MKLDKQSYLDYMSIGKNDTEICKLFKCSRQGLIKAKKRWELEKVVKEAKKIVVEAVVLKTQYEKERTGRQNKALPKIITLDDYFDMKVKYNAESIIFKRNLRKKINEFINQKNPKGEMTKEVKDAIKYQIALLTKIVGDEL